MLPSYTTIFTTIRNEQWHHTVKQTTDLMQISQVFHYCPFFGQGGIPHCIKCITFSGFIIFLPTEVLELHTCLGPKVILFFVCLMLGNISNMLVHSFFIKFVLNFWFFLEGMAIFKGADSCYQMSFLQNCTVSQEHIIAPFPPPFCQQGGPLIQPN